MKNKILKRIKSNDASGAITYMGIFAMLLILMLGIWIVDMNKNLFVARQYQIAAQRATQTAIKQQNNTGGLKPEAANALINEYIIQTNNEFKDSGTGERTVFAGNCRNLPGEEKYPKMEIYFDNARNPQAGTYNTKVIQPDVSVDTTLKSPINVEELQTQFYSAGYQVIGVRIQDAVQVYFDPFGRFNCQVINLSASSITSSSKDKDDFIKIKKGK